MAEESGSGPRREAGCGVGTQLRAARERAGLSIEQAAQRLHVGSETLEALEAERFEALGAPIYVKGYLGRYAELLGESAQMLQERLAAAAEMPQPDLTRIPRAPAARPDFLTPVLIGLGVLAATGLTWWGWSHRHDALRVPLVSGPFAARTAPKTASAPRAGPAQHAVVTAPVRAAGTSTAVPMKRGVVAAPASAVGATARITLSFPAASWVAVSDALGNSLYQGTVSAGSTRSFVGPAPLHVVLGYADGIAATVDGRPVSIKPYVGRDHAVSITVTASGQVMPAPRSAGG